MKISTAHKNLNDEKYLVLAFKLLEVVFIMLINVKMPTIVGISTFMSMITFMLIVGEPRSHIVQKRTFFAPKRYTAGILYTDSLNSA